MIVSVSPTAQAALGNCNANQIFPGIINQAIVTPMDFDSMPNGSLVGRTNLKTTEFLCTVNVNDTIGVRLVPVPGTTIVSGVTLQNHYYNDGQYYSGVIYTTPELEARGLGYTPHFFSGAGFVVTIRCNNNSAANINFGNYITPPPLTEQPIIWRTIGNNCPFQPPTGHTISIRLTNFVQFVKIGNASQHATLPQNFTAPLLQATAYNQTAPAASLVVSWTITGFASRVITRTCTTPSASESTLYLGIFNQQEIQTLAPGATTPPREFTLTFTCPYAAYESVSFTVEPMHGAHDATHVGAMNIAQGPGMAKGVAVNLEEYGFLAANQWRPVTYNSYPLLGPGTGKYLLATFSNDNLTSPSPDPLTEPPRQQVVKFRASLIRLNEPVAAGQVKAAALIHIRYN